MLAGLPSLKELECSYNESLSGNINSLRVLKDTLEKVKITFCCVDGNLKDLADFPHLKSLNLTKTAVTGDVREIDVNDFCSLEWMWLPSSVYGGLGHPFQRISDVPAFINSIYRQTQYHFRAAETSQDICQFVSAQVIEGCIDMTGDPI
jgi:hypothetical protein